MKKSFKRAIACILTVIMVVCSFPFSAFAMTDAYGHTYTGYDDLYGEGVLIPFETIVDIRNGDDFNMDSYADSVTLGVVVSSLGNTVSGDFTEASNLNTGYYGQTTAMTYDTVKEAGRIVNPAKLKKGQLIAIAFEMGGYDVFLGSEFAANLNKEYLAPGSFVRNPTTRKMEWARATDNSKGVLKKTNSFYPGVIDIGSAYNVASGNIYTGLTIEDVSGGSLFIGNQEGCFGTYGMTMGIMSAEVLQDCNLADVINWTRGDNTTRLYTYDPQTMYDAGYVDHYTEFEMYTEHPLKVVYADYDEGSVTAEYTVNFVNAAGETVSTAKYAEGTKAADVTVPANTAMAQGGADGHITYAWPEVADVTADATYTETATTTAHDYDAGVIDPDSTCTAEGTKTYTCQTCQFTMTETVAVKPHTEVEIPAVPATCETDGLTAGVKCSVCNTIITPQQTVPKLGHDYTGAVTDNKNGTHNIACANGCGKLITENCTWDEGEITTPPTVTTPGEKTYTCTACGGTKTEEIPAIDCKHETTELQNAKAATCTADGYTGDKVCTVCGTTVEQGTVIAKLGHDLQETAAATESTCSTHGHTAVMSCSRCDYAEGGDELALNPANHEDVVNVAEVPATCEADGATAYTHCNACDKNVTEPAVIKALGHDWGDWTVTKEATVKEDGVETRTCKRDASHVETRAIKALGVNITVPAETLGTVTVNGEDVTAGATVNVPYGSDVVLSAVPQDGAEFFGWEVNGVKIISKNATATVKAIADATYDAIITVPAVKEDITVVFYDMFGNVLNTQTVTDAKDIVVPAGPQFVGYTFDGWSLTDDEIHALKADATITAKYSKVTANLYTVTADGCTITSNGVEVADKLTDVAYDTQVTVKADGATAWKINNAFVAYGDTYTFYVGSDVTVEPVFDSAVTTTPVVAAVSTDRIENSPKVVFLATRSTEGGEYVNAGFIYGKNLAESDLVLEKIGKPGSNADSGIVKAYYCATLSEQFSLSYGVSAMAGTASARAFLAYVDDNGDTQVVYAEPQVYNY